MPILSRFSKTIRLFRAVETGNLEQVRALLDAGVPVCVRRMGVTSREETALTVAIEKEHVPLVRFLLDRGANPHETLGLLTPLLLAAQQWGQRQSESAEAVFRAIYTHCWHREGSISEGLPAVCARRHPDLATLAKRMDQEMEVRAPVVSVRRRPGM